ncbi:hypothetical protein [Kitasatospora sp. NPDC005856]|uniref:hypothetical protein n=1 Tax=Kitasatospora sp. NPDC005856 TaxID=3154566 RepID=UPI0033D57D9A
MSNAGVIIIPQPAHHGSGMPTEYVIGYIAIALIVWIVTAVLLARYDDNSDTGLAVMAGAAAAIGWPLVVLGLPVWLLARAASRKPKRD